MLCLGIALFLLYKVYQIIKPLYNKRLFAVLLTKFKSNTQNSQDLTSRSFDLPNDQNRLEQRGHGWA